MAANGGYILVVDDNEDARAILTKVLVSAGYSAVTAVSGKDALECIEAEQPSLILLDLMMPEMSGFEMLTRLREDPIARSIPVIVLSAYLSGGDDGILRLPGVVRIIPKGRFRITELLGAVRDVMSGYLKQTNSAASRQGVA